MRSTQYELLGGIDAARFLALHWQKRLRLVRRAIDGFYGLISRDALRRIAARDDVESRLVIQTGNEWTLEHGPFPLRRYRSLPPTGWTLLVQGLNLVHPAADLLLRRFNFIPYARLDDVMVSHAAPAGGVGPHFDSYDVFLLQGAGRRRWRTSAQRDLALRPDSPLKLLARFQPSKEWILDPGDMLYLPPSIAHDGIAIDDCMTYSIGFRAPQATELAREFLAYLDQRLDLTGQYRDPDLRSTRHPARIEAALITRLAAMVESIRWSRATIADFAGCCLSTPKQHVQFSAPSAPVTMRTFLTRARRVGVRLDAATLLLYQGAALFINGESVTVPAVARNVIRRLADQRELSGTDVIPEALSSLHAWYLAGLLHLGAS